MYNFNNDDSVVFTQHVHVPQAVSDPGLFQGTPGDNAVAFSNNFETIAEASGWDDKRKCLYFPCFLRGLGRSWWSDYSKTLDKATLDFFQLKRDFCAHFHGAAFKELAMMKLNMRLQSDTESFEKYYYDVLNLCDSIDTGMSEDSRVRYLLRGMRPTLVEKIFPLRCTRASQILEHAVNHEAARYAVAQRTLMATLFEPHVSGAPSLASAAVAGASGGMQHSQGSSLQGVHGTVAAISVATDMERKIDALTEEIRALKAGRDRGRDEDARDSRPAPRDPYRGEDYRYRGPPSRTVDGWPRCQLCGRSGHTAFNCRVQPPRPFGGDGYRGGYG